VQQEPGSTTIRAFCAAYRRGWHCQKKFYGRNYSICKQRYDSQGAEKLFSFLCFFLELAASSNFGEENMKTFMLNFTKKAKANLIHFNSPIPRG
jgi:hypothetical protein